MSIVCIVWGYHHSHHLSNFSFHILTLASMYVHTYTYMRLGRFVAISERAIACCLLPYTFISKSRSRISCALSFMSHSNLLSWSCIKVFWLFHIFVSMQIISFVTSALLQVLCPGNNLLVTPLYNVSWAFVHIIKIFCIFQAVWRPRFLFNLGE